MSSVYIITTNADISRGGHDGTQYARIILPDEPIFSRREEAEVYLSDQFYKNEWKVTELTPGENTRPHPTTRLDP